MSDDIVRRRQGLLVRPTVLRSKPIDASIPADLVDPRPEVIGKFGALENAAENVLHDIFGFLTITQVTETKANQPLPVKTLEEAGRFGVSFTETQDERGRKIARRTITASGWGHSGWPRFLYQLPTMMTLESRFRR